MDYSNSLLVMTPEPDFSMPFNVNAITHMLFGILLVNTVFALYKEKTEEVEDKTDVDEKLKELKANQNKTEEDNTEKDKIEWKCY